MELNGTPAVAQSRVEDVSSNELRATTTYAPLAQDRAISRIMQHVCGVIAFESGYEISTVNSLTVLSDLAILYMSEICRITKLVCEHSGRVLPIENDVELALRNSGVSNEKIIEQIQRLTAQPPTPLRIRSVNPTKEAVTLKVGEPAHRPAHIPAFLPPFPEPHTFIETSVSCEPDVSYARHRLVCAEHQHKVDMSLIGFLLTRYPNVCLLSEYEQRVRNEARQQLDDEAERKRRRLDTRPGNLTDWRLVNGNAVMLENLRDENGRSSTNEIRSVAHNSTFANSTTSNHVDGPSRRLSNGRLSDPETNGHHPNGYVADGSNSTPPTSEPSDELEELFEWKQTENSLVREKLKSHFQILLPFPDSRPYLSALLPVDVADQQTKPAEKKLDSAPPASDRKTSES